jgi:phosphoribosylglycinamide formyltransferase 1
MALGIRQGQAGGIASGDGAQQLLHVLAAAEPLKVTNQRQGAVGLAAPAKILITATTHLEQHRLSLPGEPLKMATPLGLKTKSLQAGRQHVGIVQHGGQDGEMGHGPMPAFPDPSHPDCSVQWPLPQPAKPSEGDQQLRLAVMASGSGSNFEALVQACCAGSLRGEVALLVVNNPGCAAISRAERLGVPWQLIDHRSHSSREALDRALINVFRQQEIDLVVMAGWMRVVTSLLIAAFPERLVNIHPSLLPSFRGMNAAGQALEAGVTLAGCTAHLVSEDVDAGLILVQAAVPVLADDDLARLSQRIQQQEHRILPLAVQLAAERLGLHR